MSTTSPSPSGRFARRWWIGFAALALGALSIGLAIVARVPPAVRLTSVVRGTAIDAVYAGGTVETASHVDVKARIAGSVAPLLVNEGGRVRRGQLLGRIDAPELHIALDRERAAADAARRRRSPAIEAERAQERLMATQIADARADLTQAEYLARADTTPARDVERARLRVAALEQQLAAASARQRETDVLRSAEVLRSESELATSRSHALDAELRAPIDGDVLRVLVDPGRLVQIGEPLLRLGDTQHIQIEALVDEEDVVRVRAGAEAVVRLDALANRSLRGHVTRVAPEAERERHAFRTIVLIDEKVEGLRPGMSAEVEIVVARRDGALLVAREAVRNGAVLRLEAGRLRRRDVRIGIGDLDMVEVLEGVTAGDLVVAAPDDTLADGDRARPAPSSGDPDGGASNTR